MRSYDGHTPPPLPVIGQIPPPSDPAPVSSIWLARTTALTHGGRHTHVWDTLTIPHTSKCPQCKHDHHGDDLNDWDASVVIERLFSRGCLFTLRGRIVVVKCVVLRRRIHCQRRRQLRTSRHLCDAHLIKAPLYPPPPPRPLLYHPRPAPAPAPPRPRSAPAPTA